jgi:hypothetical protein
MSMRAVALALLVSSMLGGCAARATVSTRPDPVAPRVTEQDILQEFQPDRPDVANGTHLVPVGLLQVEAGAQGAYVTAGNQSASLPISVRLGLSNRLEARVESYDDLYETVARQTEGISGLSVGAKIALGRALAVAPRSSCRSGARAARTISSRSSPAPTSVAGTTWT